MKVALDSMLFIYLFEGDTRYNDQVRLLFSRMEEGKLEAVTSLMSPLEVLSTPTLEDSSEKLAIYTQFFQKTPNLSIVSLSWEIALAAASLRRKFNLRTPDSIQLATAVTSNVEMFVTNDVRLSRLPSQPFKVVLIGGYK